jgi:L-alanine-DL-glutamate epimerase-like enolase superfamily enzyme
MESSVIVDIEIRACRGDDELHELDAVSAVQLPGGSRPDFTVITLTAADGTKGTSFGFGALDAKAAAHVMGQVKPFFLGRDAFHTQAHLKDFELFDRRWNLTPIYAYGPFDNACWDIIGKQSNQPVYRLLGAAKTEIPLYVSSMFLTGPEDYVRQALEVKARGFKGYKLHPPGDPRGDIECYRAVREAVGDDFTLMADPVIAYNYEQALTVGRELEKLGYRWLEESLLDVNFNGLRKLREKLDLPICGTEVLAGGHYSTAHYIHEGLVDIVRTDVSWRGGITSVMKTGHTAESFGVQCELHTTLYQALEQVQIHASLALPNSEFFEMLYPFEDFTFGTLSSIEIVDGMVQAPTGIGLGIDYDWDFIENHTVLVL